MSIDFVILWVDRDDPEWSREYEHYRSTKSIDIQVEFRDWGMLKYIFRGFERFTPWVRKIHFVTHGHLPDWINVDHPKLNIVRHKDILKKEDTPVFNSNAIEPNIYKTRGLSEKFVLFNDDFFVTSPLAPDRFFQNGLPCDVLVSNTLSSSGGVGHFVLNNLEILNRHFGKREAIRKNLGKWFNPAYGAGVMRSLLLISWPRFTGFVDPHQPQPFLKSTFQEVWQKESEILEQTSTSKFRSCSDVNQYLFRYWQLAKGTFVPVSMKDSSYVTLNMKDLRSGKISDLIDSGRYSMVCLNDDEGIRTEEEFKEAKKIIRDAFEKILPDKSSFEI